MHRFRFPIWTALMAGAALASGAGATMPASREQVVCRNEAAFVGVVLQSQDRVCRLPDLDPACGHSFTVSATVRIDQLIPPSEGDMREGALVSLASPALNRVRNEAPGLQPGARYLFLVSRDAATRTYRREVYPMSAEAWLRELWPSASCRRWRAVTRDQAQPPVRPSLPTD